MLSRCLGGLAAAAVALVACVLVILDLTDAGLRRWWDAHALTTNTVAGLLVLMITVLVVDQVVRLRQGNSKARAVAVQVAILMTQAKSASQAASQVLAGSGDRDIARQEFRTYTMMLLAVAPTLIDANTSRNFLEQAQHLDGEMALALNWFATYYSPCFTFSAGSAAVRKRHRRVRVTVSDGAGGTRPGYTSAV